MYKVTNVYETEKGFETDGKMFVLKPGQSVNVNRPPEENKEIFEIKEIGKGEEKINEKKADTKPPEQKTKNKKQNDKDEVKV